MKNRTLRKSFANAWTGLSESLQKERNLRLHFLFLMIVFVCAAWLQLDLVRWALLFVASGLVVITELINTAIEHLVDMVTKERCEEARRVKDMAAGAVLVSAFFAVFIGIAVFLDPALTMLTEMIH